MDPDPDPGGPKTCGSGSEPKIMVQLSYHSNVLEGPFNFTNSFRSFTKSSQKFLNNIYCYYAGARSRRSSSETAIFLLVDIRY
jgi:hypothetical protein